MEVILLQDVKNLGYKNDIVRVKDGYANNYLIPRGLAIIATDSAKKVREETLRQQQHKEQYIRNEAEQLKEKLLSTQIQIAAKASSSTGKIFGSVNDVVIADTLKEKYGFAIDRKMIHTQPIKELGKHTIQITLYKDITCDLVIEVIAE